MILLLKLVSPLVSFDMSSPQVWGKVKGLATAMLEQRRLFKAFPTLPLGIIPLLVTPFGYAFSAVALSGSWVL